MNKIEKYTYENRELLHFKYDNNTTKTRTIKKLLKDKKGICFDFVNYLYHKYNKKGKCYFMWFNNKQGSTHTIYITVDGYYIEATPPSSGELKEIYVTKIKNVNELAENLSKQFSTMFWKDSPKFRICEYKPKNISQTIDQFIDDRWIDGNFDNEISQEDFDFVNTFINEE